MAKKTYKKAKQTRITREFIFRQLISAIGSQIFEFYDLPDGLTSYEINIALATGRCIIADIGPNVGGVNHGFVCAPAYCETPMRLDGTAEFYIMDIPTDGAYQFKDTDKMIMLRNSYAMINTLANANWFAAEFANIDSTLRSLTKGARRSPVIKTLSCNVSAYNEAAKNVYNEDAEIQVVSDNSDLLTPNGTAKDSVINFTDPAVSDKLHFISEYREELERRICTLHGVPFSTTAKSTQNLTDELHDMDIISQFLNDSIINCVRDDLAVGNAKCGTNIKVRYGRLIREQIDLIHKTQEKETATEDKPAEDNTNDADGGDSEKGVEDNENNQRTD